MQKFKNTSEIEPLRDFLGQDRAITAMELGLRIDNPAYNMYLAGDSGTGKTTYAMNALNKYAAKKGNHKDWCYVYNFENPREPIVISLERGKGKDFKEDIEEMIDKLFEEIKEASKLACANEFIEGLELGYNTEIGERGIGLSGGQKQRIAIARSLVRKAKILILDDSTSALDMETEHELLKNLSNRKHESTTFIIAHRISAVKNADLIIYLEDGQIKESGTHDELLKKKGRYYDIYNDQFRDFNLLEEEVI